MTLLLKTGRRRASAVVETAIVLPFLFLILYGIWEVGRLIHVSQIVGNSAREGARLSSTGIYTSSAADASKTANQVQLAVVNYMQNAGLALTGNGVLVTVTNETRSNVSCQCQAVPTSGTTSLSTQVQVTALTTPTIDPTTDTSVLQFDLIRVDVQYPFSFARWASSNGVFFLGSNQQVYSSARWPCMRDKPIVVNTTIPNQPY